MTDAEYNHLLNMTEPFDIHPSKCELETFRTSGGVMDERQAVQRAEESAAAMEGAMASNHAVALLDRLIEECAYHEKRSSDMHGALGDANVEIVNLRAKLATMRTDLLQPIYEELMFVASFQKPTRKQVVSVLNKVAKAIEVK